MAFSNFRWNIILRVTILTLFIFLLALSIWPAGWIVTPFILLGAITLSVIELIKYLERTNRDFTRFLLSLQNSDFVTYPENDYRGKTFSEFHKAFNIITKTFQQARTDKETNFIFLQTVIADLSTALIAFDVNGDVKLINESAKTLFHLPYLKNINSLQQFAPKLAEYLNQLKPEGNSIFELQIHHELLKLAGRSIDFDLQGIPHKLVSIQDIRTEVEATEIDAWEQLLHVLTHEIMNSMTPISSLSATLKKKADLLFVSADKSEDISDVSEGLNVIAKRSEGLIRFVNQYKTLINLPAPSIKLITINELFNRVILLKMEWLMQRGIRLFVNIRQPDIYLRVDPDQVEQVLINVINNAADALENIEHPTIELLANHLGNRSVLNVIDNGRGIAADIADRLFIPFFSTKKNGTGIGLSLSKQIMRKNGGNISIQSLPDRRTVCTLEFVY